MEQKFKVGDRVYSFGGNGVVKCSCGQLFCLGTVTGVREGGKVMVDWDRHTQGAEHYQDHLFIYSLAQLPEPIQAYRDALRAREKAQEAFKALERECEQLYANLEKTRERAQESRDQYVRAVGVVDDALRAMNKYLCRE